MLPVWLTALAPTQNRALVNSRTVMPSYGGRYLRPAQTDAAWLKAQGANPAITNSWTRLVLTSAPRQSGDIIRFSVVSRSQN